MEDDCRPSRGLPVFSWLTLSNFGTEIKKKTHTHTNKATVTFQKIKTPFKEGDVRYEGVQEAFETD